MFKKKLDIKVNWATLKVVITLTVIFTGIGFLFGRILETIFFDSSIQTVTPAIGNQNPVIEEIGDSSADYNEEVAVATHSENTIFIMQLGVFETFDNAAALAGRLESLDITRGVNRIDGRFYVVSHIVGDRDQLAEVEEELIQMDLTPFIRPVEVNTDELKWYYFLKAVQQVPFEMDSEFIQMFNNDELHIFGLYMALSSVSFEALCNERQEILLDVYNWLNS